MSDKTITIGKIVDTWEPVAVSLDDIIEDKALIQANSRGGKSYLVRKFCEKFFGKVPIIILDPEGEYSTLREKFDFLLVGSKSDGADIPISVKIAGILATKLIEDSMSAILDLSELLVPDQIKFVKIFSEILANQKDKKLWHATIIILDEAHIFAPEKGQGEAESLSGVMALASKGGKRGYALICATQRPAKLSKNVTNELNTKFIGRAGGYDDIQRAKQELGLPKSTPDSMFRIKHEFFAMGPAISEEVIRIKADPVETTHKKNALNYKTQTPTPEGIKKLLSKFADIPEEAEKELKTKEDMQKHIKELTVRLHQLEKQQPKPVVIDPQALQKAEQLGYQKGTKEAERKFTKFQTDLKNLLRNYKPIFNRIVTIGNELSKASEVIPEIDKFLNTPLDLKLPTETKLPTLPITVKPDSTIPKGIMIAKPIPVENQNNGELTGPEKKIIQGLLSLPNQQGYRIQVAFASGYSSSKAGGFANPLGSLRSKGYVKYDGQIVIPTDEARNLFPDVEPMTIDKDTIQQFWVSQLPGPEQKIIRPIIDAYPNELTRAEVAEAAGYENPKGGGFANPLGHLRSLSLIEYRKDQKVVASRELFPE